MENEKEEFKNILIESQKNELVEAIEDGDDEKAKILMTTILDDVNEMVKYLIDLGADLNKTDNEEDSPIMKSVYNGHFDIVQLLINAGADINFVNQFGSSALSRAASKNNLGIFELLISSEVDIGKCGGKALFSASLYANFKNVHRLIELGVDVNYVDFDEGNASLHCACLKNNLRMIDVLMSSGADETITNNEGKTPIELTSNEEIKEYITNFKPTKFVLK